ncbi:hypothetical protein BGW38_001411 [Lunasporangiospora selenospora]|uniref:RRM domain-containing protein n=1 Tax=Lunasporangiospora selenospora TaxID=979761 RepID=A0A9P6FUD3_9FUNG|nr:hypothetical protein BGW38_001411 [Lunasporangiospora selenospora]
MEQFASQQPQGSPASLSQSGAPNSTGSGPSSSYGPAFGLPGNGDWSPSFQPDENAKTIYVGNLDQSVNENILREFFAQTGGQIETIKIIRDRNYGNQGGLNYGFVEFAEHAGAELALQNMNGRRFYNQDIKVNWAFTGQAAGKEDTASHFHIFVGDLSPEVNDESLSKAFSGFGSMTDARVMWDSASGKSRGYGFAAYKDRTDAERAIAAMNGQMLGSRAVRCNWATQRGMPGPSFGGHGEMFARMHHHHTHGNNAFKMVAGQTPHFNTTVYVGNLPPHTTQEDLVPFFQPFGYIVDIRLQADRGFAFVKMETHEKAANAIVRLAGTSINGRPAKLSWGKDRAAENAARGNAHYGYYNNGPGYPMNGTGGHHQNSNGGYSYGYNNNGANFSGQGYMRNGGAHQQHHQQHHHHHQSNFHHHHHNQAGHHHNQHFQQQQHAQGQQGGSAMEGVQGTPGSGDMAAGSPGMASNVVPGSNGSNDPSSTLDQYSFNNGQGNGSYGGSR